MSISDKILKNLSRHWINVKDRECAELNQPQETFDFDRAACSDAPFCHGCFRKTLTMSNAPDKIMLHLAACSLYKCHVNGTMVMFGPARSPAAYRHVDSFAIDAYLTAGKNVIAIETVYVGPRTEYDYGDPGFCCAIESNHEVIYSDATWKYRNWHAYACKEESGPLRGTYPMEKLYLDRIDQGWTGIEYDDSDWREVFTDECTTTTYSLRPRPFPLPELLEMPLPEAVDCQGSVQLKPTLKIASDSPDSYVILDFGRTVSGLYEIAGFLPTGTTLTAQYLEWLSCLDGSSAKMGFPCGETRFFLVGAGKKFAFQTFHPYSCRYLKITVAGLPPESHAEITKIRAREVCSLPTARHAHARCSNPILNRIIEAAQHTLRVCAPDMYVDCSSHERRIYLHDSLWQIEAGNIFYGDTAISQAFLDMVPDCGGRLERFPHLIQNGVLCSGGSAQKATLGHNLTWIIQGFVHSQFTGNVPSADFFAAAKGILEDTLTVTTPEGLIAHDDGLCMFLDWSKMHVRHGVIIGMNALYYKAMDMLAQATGDRELIRRAVKLRETLREIILPFVNRDNDLRYSRLVPDLLVRNADGKLTPFQVPQSQSFGYNSEVASSETTQYWVLWSGLLETPEERRLWQVLRELKVNEESRLDDNRLYAFSRAGLFGLWVRMSYAFENHDIEVVYRDIHDICRPMIEAGDTLWESIGADSRSNAHGFNAYAGTLLYRCVSGIMPGDHGYQQPIIAPQPGTFGLTWGRGFMQLDNGIIHVAWTTDYDVFSLSVSLPEGVTAKVVLPPEAVTVATRGGHTIECLEFPIRQSCRILVEMRNGLSVDNNYSR